MPRIKSEDRRSAILAAATRLIVAEGLSAPTMRIAKEAGIPNGSLFTYFATKAELYNALYLELKNDLATTAMAGIKTEESGQDEFFRVWRNWTGWAISFPDQRQALSQLNLSEDLSAETRLAAQRVMKPIAGMIEECRASGPMRRSSLHFVSSLVHAVADSTMEMMMRDPSNAARYRCEGFEAVMRILDPQTTFSLNEKTAVSRSRRAEQTV